MNCCEATRHLLKLNAEQRFKDNEALQSMTSYQECQCDVAWGLSQSRDCDPELYKMLKDLKK